MTLPKTILFGTARLNPAQQILQHKCSSSIMAAFAGNDSPMWLAKTELQKPLRLKSCWPTYKKCCTSHFFFTPTLPLVCWWYNPQSCMLSCRWPQAKRHTRALCSSLHGHLQAACQHVSFLHQEPCHPPHLPKEPWTMMKNSC